MSELIVKKGREETLLEVIQKILFVNGWGRLLVAENVSGTGLCRIRAADTGVAGDFSDADVVGLYTDEEYRDGRVTKHSIQAACRKFVLARDSR
jgi:hypothetical protein